MGLDVTAFKGLSKVDHLTFDEETGYIVDANGVEVKGNYKYLKPSYAARGHADDMAGDGVYSYTEKFSDFRMNYPSWGSFNKHLERMIRDHKIDRAAFAEYFRADTLVGATVSAKLASDFITYQDTAQAYAADMVEHGEWWFDRYNDWLKVFAIASNGGAVYLH